MITFLSPLFRIVKDENYFDIFVYLYDYANDSLIIRFKYHEEHRNMINSMGPLEALKKLPYSWVTSRPKFLPQTTNHPP
jgi:hypothetical protein